MTNQYELVRSNLHICPLCRCKKDTGLLLCWTCHYEQKQHHNGGYSKSTEALLLRLDTALATGSEAAVEAAFSPKGWAVHEGGVP